MHLRITLGHMQRVTNVSYLLIYLDENWTANASCQQTYMCKYRRFSVHSPLFVVHNRAIREEGTARQHAWTHARTASYDNIVLLRLNGVDIGSAILHHNLGICAH